VGGGLDFHSRPLLPRFGPFRNPFDFASLMELSRSPSWAESSPSPATPSSWTLMPRHSPEFLSAVPNFHSSTFLTTLPTIVLNHRPHRPQPLSDATIVVNNHLQPSSSTPIPTPLVNYHHQSPSSTTVLNHRPQPRQPHVGSSAASDIRSLHGHVGLNCCLNCCLNRCLNRCLNGLRLDYLSFPTSLTSTSKVPTSSRTVRNRPRQLLCETLYQLHCQLPPQPPPPPPQLRPQRQVVPHAPTRTNQWQVPHRLHLPTNPPL
jgi:hypothetical protein